MTNVHREVLAVKITGLNKMISGTLLAFTCMFGHE